MTGIRNFLEASSVGSHDISVITVAFHGIIVGIVIAMLFLDQETFRAIHARVGIAGLAGLARKPGIQDVGIAGILDLLRKALEEGEVGHLFASGFPANLRNLGTNFEPARFVVDTSHLLLSDKIFSTGEGRSHEGYQEEAEAVEDHDD